MSTTPVPEHPLPASKDTTPVLRTLSPALRALERSLRNWLDGSHRYPLSTINRATLEGIATDLRRQSEALDVERPLLVVMLMGGTGVGKSTLLNALAAGTIAPASFTRPTTRDPIVYYHESVRPDRLDPALRHCRLVPHDRPNLAQKVIVDTPDLDSTDPTNRDKTLRLLPVADVILYVGSQEKYHDELGWKVFREQRKRRAFAFVLNKWDRCSAGVTTGLRPDEDLLRDLESEGFRSPLLFRTCANLWAEQPPADGERPRPSVPEGEQFEELINWLEMGLTRIEVEAIKARGVSQMLAHMQSALRDAAPPDLVEVAGRVKVAWEKPLEEEGASTADVLVNALEPYQKEIEHHFALEGQRRFRGLMAWYLQMVTRARYVGSNLRQRLPLVSRLGSRQEPEPARWDLTLFTRACSEVAASRELDARNKALVNRLLIDADTQGYPLELLTEPVEGLANLDWRQRYAQALMEVLEEVETEWAKPTGVRWFVQGGTILLANWLPPIALLAALVNLLWRAFDPLGERYPPPTWVDIFLPGIILLVTFLVLHLLITLLLPLRWDAIRDEFHRRLQVRARRELDTVFSAVPGDVAAMLLEERKKVEKLVGETAEVANWLEKREQAASIAGLYGN